MSSMDSSEPFPLGALTGRRILETGGGAAAYCTKLLADLGAQVIKLEPPGGEAGRCEAPLLAGAAGHSIPFLYLNANKQSVVADLDTSEGQETFRALAAASDIVVDAHPTDFLEDRGLGYAALAAANPQLVLTSISGFGRTGPYRSFRSNDLVASALGGAMVVIGDPADPPVRLAGSQADIATATCAAASSLIALRHCQHSGRGQLVDIAANEVVAAVTHVTGVGKWLDDGVIPIRNGTGLTAAAPSGAYACIDGLVYLMINRAAHWKALAQWIHEVTGNEEVLSPLFDGPSSARLPYRELLDLFIGELTATLRVDEAYHEGQRRHIAFSPANTAADVLASEHLAARGFFTNLPVPGRGAESLKSPGAPYQHASTPWRIRTAAPLLGEHTGASFAARAAVRAPKAPTAPAHRQALEGIRLVEFGAGMAGPWIGRFMAWCGADVIRVESATHPDVTRTFVSPREPERGTQPQASPWLTDWNGGKRFVSLDLKNPDGAELCRRLIDKSDVVVANFSAGVIEKLGLGYAELAKRNPELVMLTSSGYGETGPQAKYVTWGSNIEALSGLMRMSGFPHRECTPTHFAYPDPLSALHGLVAVMAALDHRSRKANGHGQAINLSQFETAVASLGPLFVEFAATGREPEKLGNRSLQCAPHGCYPCTGEDRWIALAAEDDSEWQLLCEVLGRPAWRYDARFATADSRLVHADELNALLAGVTAGGRDYDWMEKLQRAGLAAGVVQNTEDLYRRDPQLAARGFFEEIDHATKDRVIASGIPLSLTGTPGRTRNAGVAVGHDNEDVLREVVGLSAEEYARYIESGAIESSSVNGNDAPGSA
jgi:crotonobetainyl-CoA:carnitine CoA-transferase CaiB-like acyl-CoA transferase